MNKRALAAGASGLFLVAVGGVAVWMFANPGSNQRWARWFPSAEMKTLRSMEPALGLPHPADRTEDDHGCYEDYKGAQHCERHIALQFSDGSLEPGLRQRLLAQGWAEHKVAKVGENDNFAFTKGDGITRYCVRVNVQPQGGPNEPLNVSLDGPTESACATLDRPLPF